MVTPLTREVPRHRPQVQRLLSARTPTPPVYAAYLSRAERVITQHSFAPIMLRTEGWATEPTFTLERSVLFKRDYLVAWVERRWLAHAAPATDALADNLGERLHRVLPPYVIAPMDRRRSRQVEFRSILEHEFVHLSQALCGDTLRGATLASVESLLRRYFSATCLEYEANLIQCVRWPSNVAATLHHYALSLEQWCLLRGHSQAIEGLLVLLARGLIPRSDRTFPAFLDEVPTRAESRLRGLGLDDSTLVWFTNRWAEDVMRATGMLDSVGMNVSSSRPYQCVARWARGYSLVSPSRRS